MTETMRTTVGIISFVFLLTFLSVTVDRLLYSVHRVTVTDTTPKLLHTGNIELIINEKAYMNA